MRDHVKARAEKLAPGKRVFPGQEVLIVNRAMEESRDVRRGLILISRGGIQSQLGEVSRAAKAHGVTVRQLKLGEGGVAVEGIADQEKNARAFLSAIESSTGRLQLNRKSGSEGFSFFAEGPGV